VDTRTFVLEESTMAKTRPPYTPEFRRQPVDLVRAGRSPDELAREFTRLATASLDRGSTRGHRKIAGRDEETGFQVEQRNRAGHC
jgi:hypothetical protein